MTFKGHVKVTWRVKIIKPDLNSSFKLSSVAFTFLYVSNTGSSRFWNSGSKWTVKRNETWRSCEKGKHTGWSFAVKVDGLKVLAKRPSTFTHGHSLWTWPQIMTNVKLSITSWISLFFLFNFLFILAISFSLSRISSFVSNILFFYRFSIWCSLEVALDRKTFWSANQREVSKWKRALTIVRSFDNPSARSWISWIDFSWLSSFCSYSFCSLFKSTRDLKDIYRWRTSVQFWKTLSGKTIFPQVSCSWAT